MIRGNIYVKLGEILTMHVSRQTKSHRYRVQISSYQFV